MDGYHVVTVNHHFLVVRADHAFSGNILITGSRAAHQFERVTISTGELRNEQAGTLFNLVAVSGGGTPSGSGRVNGGSLHTPGII